MIELTMTFIQCGHCGHRSANPVYTCPVCDWPRQHSDESAPPTVGLPDGDRLSEEIAHRGIHPYSATIPLAAPVLIPETFPEVALAPAVGATTIRSITLAPDEPEPAAPAERASETLRSLATPDADLASEVSELLASLDAQVAAPQRKKR